MINRLLDMQILFYCMVGCGVLGALGMFLVNRSYKKKMKLSQQIAQLKEKWLNLWKSRDVLLHRMNRWVWYPSLACVCILGISVILSAGTAAPDGVALRYIYVGVMVPVGLLLLRQALDISYRDELLVDSMADYIEAAKEDMEEKQVQFLSPKAQEEMVDHIAACIKESAATHGGFGQFLSPEEESIMREVIREFMV